VCICALSHSLSRSSQRRLPAASSSAAASSLLIFNSLSLTHYVCVCVLCFIIVCALYRLAGRELARCNINHTTVTKGIFDLHRSRAKMDPARKVGARFVSSAAADFLVSRALGGERAFNQVRRFFLFTKGISPRWKWKILFCFSLECLSRLLLFTSLLFV
jgi:hypothetical protein